MSIYRIPEIFDSLKTFVMDESTLEPLQPSTNHNQGEFNPMYGLKHTNETKHLISKAKIGVPRSEETKLKLSTSHSGKKHSKETKLKMSLGKLGKKRGSYKTSKKHTDGSKAKIRKALLGKKRGPYQKSSISSKSNLH